MSMPPPADGPSHDDGRIGLVDGSVESDSRTFHVVLDPEVVIQLDELVAVATDLPGGRQVTHYGIVTELRSRFEGADLPSDTGRVVDRTLPAEHVRRAEVRVLRVVPELFVAPHAGAAATRAVGTHRTAALFEDEMTRGKLPVGLDLGGAPVYADMRFVDGRSGGHVSISGIFSVNCKDYTERIETLIEVGRAVLDRGVESWKKVAEMDEWEPFREPNSERRLYALA